MQRPACPYGKIESCPFQGDDSHTRSNTHVCPYSPCPLIAIDDTHSNYYTHSPQVTYSRPTPAPAPAPRRSNVSVQFKIDCPYGAVCQWTNSEHITECWHDCSDGLFCTDTSRYHTTNFRHFPVDRSPCSAGDKCTSITDNKHCHLFYHVCTNGADCSQIRTGDHTLRFRHPCMCGLQCPKKDKFNHKNKYTHEADVINPLFGIFPPTWTHVKYNNSTPYQLSKVERTATEFANTINKFNEGLSMKGKYSNIVSLHRVENRNHWIMYYKKKSTMPFPNEKILFYSCNSRNEIDDIIQNVGFDFRVTNRVTLLGNGIYFSKLPGHADSTIPKDPDGTKEMIICQVLIGHSTNGSPNLLRPPANPATNTLFDSVNNNDLYCIFDGVQAYPSYIIKYRP